MTSKPPTKEKTQIRTLPRGDEVAAEAPQTDPVESPSKPRGLFMLLTGVLTLLALLFLLPKPKNSAPRAISAMPPPASQSDKLNQEAQDSRMRELMLTRKRELENQQYRTSAGETNDVDLLAADKPENFGVQLESDGSSERVYEDLTADLGRTDSDQTPADRINARLARRKWVTETERAERVTFIKNFIRAAREKGYEVEIDSNLVVVGVRPIGPRTELLNINQVLDKIEKDGH